MALFCEIVGNEFNKHCDTPPPHTHMLGCSIILEYLNHVVRQRGGFVLDERGTNVWVECTEVNMVSGDMAFCRDLSTGCDPWGSRKGAQNGPN